MCLRSYFQFVILRFFVRFSLNFLHSCRCTKNEREKKGILRKKLRVANTFLKYGRKHDCRRKEKKAPTTMQQIICVALTFAHMNSFMRLYVSFRPAAHSDFHFIRTVFSSSVALFGSVLFNAIFCAAQKNMILKFEQIEINR